MSSAGFKRTGVECLSCHEPFSVALGVKVMNAQELEKLPDPFWRSVRIAVKKTNIHEGPSDS